MGRIIFITGGVASGKSSFACQLAADCQDVLFIATGQSIDDEMREKIQKHQVRRPKQWHLLEIGDSKLDDIASNIKDEVVIIDCFTFYTATQLAKLKKSPEEILNSVINIIGLIKKNTEIDKCIIVSNEVGMGIVPMSKSGRLFREVLGAVNKTIMQKTDEAYLMVAGQPLKLK